MKNDRGGSVTVVCKFCQKQFLRFASLSKAKEKFCTKECQKQFKVNELALRRLKICVVCKKDYFDSTKRLVSRACSKDCANKFAVDIRKNNGSYARSEEINKKVSDTLRGQWASGERTWSPSQIKNFSENKKTYFTLNKEEHSKKVKQTSIEKYGVEHFTQNQEVKNKKKQTNIEKYGTEFPTQNEEVKSRLRKTHLSKGLIKVFDGKTMKELASEHGVSYTYFKQVVNEQGIEAARHLSIEKTFIEQKISDFLDLNSISYQYDMFIPGDEKKLFRPDFFLPNFNLIIECDGLYWHSDRHEKNNKNYHINKKKYYSNLGIKSLFFREHELVEKFSIVSSIILNKMGLNEKIPARKTKFTLLKDKISSTAFLNENHLMGVGSGKTYCLIQDSEIVSLMQVRKKGNGLEISRFCSKNNKSVVGGFSKLLKNIIRELNPVFVETFIDKRYGTGDYLVNFGFVKETEFPSFQWTDFNQCFHRMKFPKNSGLQEGLARIWDCGQAKYTLKVIR